MAIYPTLESCYGFTWVINKLLLVGHEDTTQYVSYLILLVILNIVSEVTSMIVTDVS